MGPTPIVGLFYNVDHQDRIRYLPAATEPPFSAAARRHAGRNDSRRVVFVPRSFRGG